MGWMRCAGAPATAPGVGRARMRACWPSGCGGPSRSGSGRSTVIGRLGMGCISGRVPGSMCGTSRRGSWLGWWAWTTAAGRRRSGSGRFGCCFAAARRHRLPTRISWRCTPAGIRCSTTSHRLIPAMRRGTGWPRPSGSARRSAGGMRSCRRRSVCGRRTWSSCGRPGCPASTRPGRCSRIFGRCLPVGGRSVTVRRRHQAPVMPFVRHLLWHCRLATDLDRLLDVDTVVTTAGEGPCCG